MYLFFSGTWMILGAGEDELDERKRVVVEEDWVLWLDGTLVAGLNVPWFEVVWTVLVLWEIGIVLVVVLWVVVFRLELDWVVVLGDVWAEVVLVVLVVRPSGVSTVTVRGVSSATTSISSLTISKPFPFQNFGRSLSNLSMSLVSGRRLRHCCSRWRSVTSCCWRPSSSPIRCPTPVTSCKVRTYGVCSFGCERGYVCRCGCVATKEWFVCSHTSVE